MCGVSVGGTQFIASTFTCVFVWSSVAVRSFSPSVPRAARVHRAPGRHCHPPPGLSKTTDGTDAAFGGHRGHRLRSHSHPASPICVDP